MGKKTKTAEMLDDLLAGIKSQLADNHVENYIPDIITFCESPYYLNITENLGNPIKLHPLQIIALKVFYRGTQGNENLELTPSEIELLKKEKMDYVIDKYESGNLFRECVLVWGRRCISEYEVFFDARTGKKNTFGELWDSGNKTISTYSLDESNFHFKTIDESKLHYNGIEQTYKVELKTGRSIRVTDNHPFLTTNGWKELKYLKPGDCVATPAEFPIFGNSNQLTEEEASLLGYAVRNKCCSSSSNKTPSIIFESPKNIIAAYLKALFSCDGNICYTITSVSKQLANDIHHLLIRFGIVSFLIKKASKGIESYQVKITSTKYVEKFLSQLPPGLKPCGLQGVVVKQPWRGQVAEANRETSETNSYDSILWLPIKKISKAEKCRTFDIEVSEENYHNFVAGDIVLHNSGKNLIVSLMALYEAMRLLEVTGGNPFAYYKIKEGDPIYILTVANSGPQAEILFNEIKSTLLSSPYFQDKIGLGGKAIESLSIHLMTLSDKKRNQELEKQGIDPIKGSIVILSGHSNSDTLRGHRAFTICLDEVASYKMSAGSSGGETIYNSLSPSTNDFRVYYEENGEKKDRLDSKIISISSPRGKEGIFWRIYNESFHEELGKQRFAMRAPTWKVNLAHSRESCRRDFPFMTEQEFNMEFGAEFIGLEGEKFISDEYIDRAIDSELGQRMYGIAGISYFGHVDPAATSHNYAFAITHVEDRIKETPLGETGKIRRERVKRFIIDHLKIWTPTGNVAIDFQAVDNYIIEISKKFRFSMVSYDAFESRQSMQRLRQHGVPCKLTHFRKRYKVEIYRNLENLFISGNISLPGNGPHAKLAEMELKNLKRKWTAGGGFKIEANPEGEVHTDDIADAIAGACGVASDYSISGLPKPESVYMPIFGDQQNIWRIGQGSFNNQQLSWMEGKFGINI